VLIGIKNAFQQNDPNILAVNKAKTQIEQNSVRFLTEVRDPYNV
jgi:hypothetical protein